MTAQQKLSQLLKEHGLEIKVGSMRIRTLTDGAFIVEPPQLEVIDNTPKDMGDKEAK